MGTTTVSEATPVSASDSALTSISVSGAVSTVAAKIFSTIDRDNHGFVRFEDAEEIIMQVNEQLERKLSSERAKEILVEFCTEDSKLIEREQFLRAFEMLTTEL